MIILFVNFEEISKIILVYRRSASGKWINNLTTLEKMIEKSR